MKRKTHEKFCEEVYNLVGNEYKVLGNYINSDTKVLMEHNIDSCHYIWEVIPYNFLKQNGTRCPKCFGRPRKTTEQFKQEVYDLVGDEYEVLGEYINSLTKILMKHKKCGYKWEVRPSDFLRGHYCPYCAGNLPCTTEIFKERVKELEGEEYEVLGEYKNAHTKIRMKHNICGCEYEVEPNCFLKGGRCPICAESNGEKRIRHWLKKNNIKFKRQYTFDDCRRIQPLPFDFAILNDDKKVKYLIEYDGVFHYKPIISNKHLIYQKENDALKNLYCKENNIPLLHIPYWEFNNIEKILENFIQ